jgi:hypothetical protein
MTDHLVHRPEAEFGHDGTQLVGDIVEEVDDMLGRAGELLAELGILRGDADRASVPTNELAIRFFDTFLGGFGHHTNGTSSS